MDIIFLVILIVFTIYFLFGATKTVNTFCKLHTWEYKDQPGNEKTQYLQCSTCNFLPGHDSRNEK